MSVTQTGPAGATLPAGGERLGVLLVALAAICWSFGGAIAHFIEANDAWTVVFWRSVWAMVFLLGFMFWRDGISGTLTLFRRMGLPGLAVAACFTTASISFIVALQFTTVANVLLMQAGAPLIAALMAWAFFRERTSPATWAAIAAVILGIAIMVSESVTGAVSPVGDALALTIAFCYAAAIVLTRRFAHVRMTPATCLATIFAAIVAATQTSAFIVSGADMGWLVAFGALNLGLGLALFATGARLIPAAMAALLGTLEPVLGPVWVWLLHGETPSASTFVGGAIVFAALLVHIGVEFRRQLRSSRVGTTGLPTPM